MNRRLFLFRVGRLSLIASGASLLAACQSPSPPASAPTQAAPSSPAAAPTQPPAPKPSAAVSPAASPVAAASAAPAASPAAAASPSTAASATLQQPAFNQGVTPAGTLRWAGLQVPPNLDPHNQLPPTGDFITRLCFDPLVAPYANGQFVAMLAQSFRNVDPTTWEFTLRNNVKFAGGNALTADAIKWNFDRIANPDNKLQVAARILPQYERAEVVSPLVVRLKTKTPDPIWPRRCFQVLIADPAEAQRDTFTGNPGPNAGTGIFKLLEYAAQNSATLVANANSWRGQPRLQTFTFRQLPDPAALEAALKAGDLDLAQLTPDRADCMQQAGLNVDRVAQTNVYQLWFQTRQPPFNNKVARMAAAAAIDAQNIISSLYNGNGIVAS